MYEYLLRNNVVRGRHKMQSKLTNRQKFRGYHRSLSVVAGTKNPPKKLGKTHIKPNKSNNLISTYKIDSIQKDLPSRRQEKGHGREE